jgi:uncharacterized SAM-binding protein YcdF (DUF218 family)
MQIKKNIRTVIFLIFTFILIADICIVVGYYSFVANFFEMHKSNQKTDVALVFFGDYNFVKKAFDSDTKKRLEHVLNLYHSNKTENIICVGGYRRTENFTGSIYMRNYLINKGVDRHRVFNDSGSFDTKSNLKLAKEIIEAKKFQKIALVSSPVHVYRISMLIEGDSIFYSPYKYKNQSIKDYLYLYRSIHHEWIAFFLSTILSVENYAKLLAWRRQ